MRTEVIELIKGGIGIQYELTVLHFGDERSERKVYIQGSLHADEMPGALVSYYLRQKLEQLESENRLNAHIILVPMANPIGMAQSIQYTSFGRFDLFTGRNFNRLGDLNLYEMTTRQLHDDQVALGQDAQENTRLIRQAMGKAIASYQPNNAIESLHHNLVRLAYDADIALDLHCDCWAMMHIYTLPGLWPQLEPLARYIGSHCQLVADDSNSNSFDEALSTVWLKLQSDYPQANIPLANVATTVELRGVHDLRHEDAEQDSQALINYFIQQQLITPDEQGVPPMPNLLAEPTPLAGVETIVAPVNGVVVFRVQPGQNVQAGDAILDLVDPTRGQITTVHATIDGFVYACNTLVPFAHIGSELATIAGAKELAHGARLSP
jgi:predicted deacylase